MQESTSPTQGLTKQVQKTDRALKGESCKENTENDFSDDVS